MNKIIITLLLLLSVEIFTQEINDDNVFNPSIGLVIESNGITNYHFTDDKYNNLDVKFPYGMD